MPPPLPPSACSCARRQRAQLSLKSGNYLIVDPELKRTDNEGSLLAFYVNGKLQGVPFTQLGREWFYPAISLFGEVTVSAHFGPAFLFVSARRRARGRPRRALAAPSSVARLSPRFQPQPPPLLAASARARRVFRRRSPPPSCPQA